MRFDRRWALLGAIVMATLGTVSSAAAADDVLQIEPASTVVARDTSFTIRIVQRASAPISGAQATVVFDPKVLQVTTVTPAGPYASAPLFLGGDAPGIRAANQTGRLKTVAAAFFPPASVPAGDHDFLHVGFRAIGCGRSDLGLPAGPADAGLLDGAAAYGSFLTVVGGAGTVAVDCGAATGGGDAALAAGGSGLPLIPIVGLATLVIAGAALAITRRRA